MARPLHRLWRSASLLPLCEAQARPCHDVASVVRCDGCKITNSHAAGADNESRHPRPKVIEQMLKCYGNGVLEDSVSCLYDNVGF
uniref:Uncharacterized protein n=2 Tax=Oryza sativa subsp. japonica TaxID=39947 RepID=Q2R596_ORYSJ|nr:hypothetical protein LOC_Os11g25770 [Oryza sativa Japonica Group]AAX96283.1 hypothetical protein [Oryza sativa Japonica Group]ABA93386.1 hypothetical protein LOC_Os11g25770 [Oryza sativa Japonica Group]